MKNIFSKLLILIIFLTSIQNLHAYDFEVDGIYYNITSMSNLEVGVTYKELSYARRNNSYNNYYYNDSYNGDIVIPATVNFNNRTFSVTSVEYSAFGQGHDDRYDTENDNHGCKITSISLPNTILKIDEYAFNNCRLLTEIKIPDSVETIGDDAFSYSMLNSIIIPESVTSIGKNAFYESSISSAIIGKSVNSIGSEAFANCKSLMEIFCTSIIKPNGLTSKTYSGSHSALEIYVPSIQNYGFGKEYISFPIRNYTYSGVPSNIEWSNNLKAYKCEIAETECKTQINAGSYTQNLKATYSNGVDFTVEIPYSYTINKAPMSLTVHDIQREYGDINPSFTCEISGFVNNETEQTIGATPSFECEATQLSNVGSYRILASLDAPNYDISYKYGTLSIIKAPISLGIVNSIKTYGDNNPNFEFTYNGLKNGENNITWKSRPQISTAADKYSKVGEYAVDVTGGEATNYNVTSYSPGVLSITKRNLTAKANDCEKLYGEENPEFKISYIGFVNNENQSVFTKNPIAECNATKDSNAGKYTISVTGGDAENYNFLYQDGQLTINPLSVGFKNIYNSVTYNDMNVSTEKSYFNYIPEITGPFDTNDFWIELWFLDKDNSYSNHVATISSGDYAGKYVYTNSDREMGAGKYIFNLTSKGINPNVTANPSRAYVTVNRANTNFEWNVSSPITIGVGETLDLGISYDANLWCTFNTTYDEAILELSSVGATSSYPHWYATGLKEGETTLYFSIQCMKNFMGYYDFSDSKTISKRIKVIDNGSGIKNVGDDSNIKIRVDSGIIYIDGKQDDAPIRVFNLQGIMVCETSDNKIENLSNGIYVLAIGNKSYKVFLK